MTIRKSILEKLEYDKIIEKLIDFTSSDLGADRIKKMTPSYNFEEIKILQQETWEASEVLRLYPQFSLRGFRDIRPFIKRASIGISLEPDNFLDISSTISSGSKVKKFFDSIEGDYSTIRRQIKRIQDLNHIKNSIEKTITSEGTIAEDASPKLRDINRSIGDTKEKVKDKLQSIVHSSSMSKKLQEQIITIRNNRYVIPVKQEYASQVSGLVHDQSASGATLFIEPMAVVELNNKLKQLVAQKKSEEEKILAELSEKVAAEKENLEEIVDALTNLDVFFAKAHFAYKLKATKPILTNDRIINLKRARHPLIDDEKVVPIDFWINEGTNMVVITGPNTGGKTVTLKTVGLLTLMAQSGLYIPADEESVIAVVDNVFADIGDEQSLEQSLSTFSSHLTNIVDILEKATINSLILFDELGAGTDPIEGAALARAILEYVHKKKIITVATTHYGSLKHFAYSEKGVENASVEFDITTLRPTYRLLMGLPGKSNAFEISKRLGLNQQIIERAKDFMDADEIEVGDLIQSLENSRRQLEKEREELHALRQETDKIREDLTQRYEKLKEKEDLMIEKAAMEAKEIIKKAKAEVKEIIQNMQITKEIQEHQQKLRNLENNLSKKYQSKEVEYAGKIPKNLLKGEEVFIPKLNQRATVVEVLSDTDDVVVQAGIMKINVKMKDLRIPENKEVKTLKQKSYTALVSEKSKVISPELNLLGYKVEEAIKEIEKYLDDAIVVGLNQVSLIHGKGTGALAKGVHEYLKNNNLVKEFRYGQHGEGGYGVTIVKL